MGRIYPRSGDLGYGRVSKQFLSLSASRSREGIMNNSNHRHSSGHGLRLAGLILVVGLELALDRGRVDLVNHKEKGPASVRVSVRDASWDLTLLEPEARIALELYGRWPRGVLFTPKPGPKEGPTADLVFLVLKGQVR